MHTTIISNSSSVMPFRHGDKNVSYCLSVHFYHYYLLLPLLSAYFSSFDSYPGKKLSEFLTHRAYVSLSFRPLIIIDH